MDLKVYENMKNSIAEMRKLGFSKKEIYEYGSRSFDKRVRRCQNMLYGWILLTFAIFSFGFGLHSFQMVISSLIPVIFAIMTATFIDQAKEEYNKFVELLV